MPRRFLKDSYAGTKRRVAEEIAEISTNRKQHQKAGIGSAAPCMKLAFALVAAVAGDIIRGASVTYDTYIRGGSNSNTNYNSATIVGWDGPFSPVDKDTKAVLIKFDLSSLGGATLVPASPVWFNYLVSDEGNPGSLRELTVSWNHVCTSPAEAHAPLTTNRVWHSG